MSIPSLFQPKLFPVNAIHVSIDFETMSMQPNAAPVQLAAIAGQHSFNEYILPSSSEKEGLHVDPGTMQWWDKQDPELQKRVFGGTTPLTQVLIQFYLWLEKVCGGEFNRVCLWGNGADFDCVILKEATEACGLRYPIDFRNHHHLRTAQACLTAAEQQVIWNTFCDTYSEAQKHDALWDARWQHAQLVEFLQKLGHVEDISTPMERVLKERNELHQKLTKLTDFLARADAKDIVGEDHLNLLNDQAIYMTSYENILNARLWREGLL